MTSHQPPERVVALVPHQDDEVLAMGAALASLRRSGVEVHAVLVTDGSRPGVATVRAVNQRALREQAPPLTHRVSIYQARTREWQASLQALGVPASHHHVEGVGDGTVSQAAARGVIERWARRYPEAAMLTLSWLDVHPDHANLGRALDAWCLVHPWRSCAFAQFPRFVVGASHTLARPVASPAGAWVGEGPDLASVRAAAAEYKRWDPRRGRYAIGWTYSVPSQFEHVMRAPRTWLHGTSRRWRTLADLQRSQQWGRVLTRGGGAR